MGGRVDFKMTEITERKGCRRLIPRIAKAALATVAVGVFLFVVWIFLSAVFSGFPGYMTLFAILAWATIFFTFAVKVSEGTIYKFIFIIARALFLIVYIVYATNCGTLTLDFKEFQLTVEFIPLLALMIVIGLLSMAKGILQALEFASQSPKD
jgi:hypothetical protein